MAIPSGTLLLFSLQEILLSGRINDKVQKQMAVKTKMLLEERIMNKEQQTEEIQMEEIQTEEIQAEKIQAEEVHTEEKQDKKKISFQQKKMLPVGIAAAVVCLGILAVVGVNKNGVHSQKIQVFKGDKSKVIEQDEQRKDTYVIGASQLPTASDSYLQTMEGAEIINKLVYSGLAEYESGEYEYVLAESITFKDGGKAAVIKLDSDAAFSDGCKITADDVVYTYHYLSSADIMYDEQAKMSCIEGVDEYYSKNAETISGIEKVSDQEIEITFSEENIDNLSMFLLPILHPESHEYSEINVESENLGAGSYKVDSNIPYQEVVLTKNESALKKGAYSTIKVVTANLNQLPEQQIDTMIIPKSCIEEIEELGAYDIYSTYGEDRDFFIFNCDSEQMSDVKNRTAFAQALDRDAMVETVFDSGRLSYGLIAGDKSAPNYDSLMKSGKSAEGLEVVLPAAYAGVEMTLFDELQKQMESAGAAIKESGDSSVSYYYGRIEDIISGWQVPEFFEGLDGKELTQAGDLLEKSLAEYSYAIPLHNAEYYTVNLCTKKDIF